MDQIASRPVYQNPWMSVREDQIRHPDGTTGLYGVVDKPDFAIVIPRAGDGFWLVEQFRYPVGRRAWEFPQGAWPAGRAGTLAEDLTAGPTAREATEQDMTHRLVSAAEFRALVASGDIADSVTLAAYSLLTLAEYP
jgi:hypothetical protein